MQKFNTILSGSLWYFVVLRVPKKQLHKEHGEYTENLRVKNKSSILIILILVLVSQPNLKAQPEFDFSGYAVNMPIYQPAKNLGIVNLKDQYFDLTRLRLRPTLYIGNNSRFNLEYEINSLYLSESGFGLFDLSSVSTRRQLGKLNWKIVEEDHFIVNHFIDRLTFRQDFNFGNIEIGRQRISWGTGRIWNPTDLFNPINPANFAKIEKDGADAISTMIYLGNFTDLNIVYNPTNDFKNSNYGFRFRTNFAGYDVSVIGGYFDDRIVTGIDFAGNLFEAGVRGEGILSFNKDNSTDNFAKFILGVDYQFTSKLYAVLEYHFNGEGKINTADYELLRLINGEIINLSKNYLYSGINYQLTPLLTIQLSDNVNLNDKSGYLGINGNYSVTEDFYLSGGAQVSYGNKFDEFWYYPKAFYLQGEFYF